MVQMQGEARNMDAWQSFAHPLGFIRLILLVDWDPIGVFGHARAMTEYDGYAHGIYDLLASDASQEDLVAHLHWIEVKTMEVRGNSNMALPAIAAKLREVFDTARANQDRAHGTKI